jgi:hypothetical protein
MSPELNDDINGLSVRTLSEFVLAFIACSHGIRDLYTTFLILHFSLAIVLVNLISLLMWIDFKGGWPRGFSYSYFLGTGIFCPYVTLTVSF